MDQELRDLIEQLRDLTQTLKDMGRAPGTTAGSSKGLDRSVDRMVAALAQVAVKLDGTKKTRLAEEEAVKKFTKSVDKAADSMQEEEKVRNDSVKAEKDREKERQELERRSKLSRQELEKEDRERRQREQKEAAAESNKKARHLIEEQRKASGTSKELFDSLSSTGGSAEVLKTKFLGLGGESMGAQIGLRMLTAGIEGATKGVKTFATGLLNGERGAQLSAKALTDFATPLINAAEIISGVLTVLSFIPGPVGLMGRAARLAGAAIFGLGAAAGNAAVKFNEIGAKQLDTLLKTFNDASRAGVSFTGGLEGTLDLLHTFNMTTAEAAQLNEMLAKSNKQLAQFGGTAGTGAKRFAEVSGALVKSKIGETFENMGITQQEQREAALLYMSIQARTGQMQLKNTEQLIQESGKFVEELDRAAQLTGATRREQQEAREAAMAETRFRAAMIDARQRGDKEELARLEVAQRTAAILKSMGDEKGFLGVLQQAAGRGALTTPEAIAAEQSYRISEILAKPNPTDQEILAILSKNADINLRNLAGTNRLVGGIDALQTNIVGMDNTILRQNALAEEAAKAKYTGPNAITKYLQDQEEKRKRPGGDLSLMIGAGRAQQAAAMTMEAGISTFNYAADVHKAASENFDKAVKQFGNIVGFKGVAGGTPTYGAGPGPTSPVTTPQQAKSALEAQRSKTKRVEEEALAAEDRARALEKDAKASRAEKEAARKKADELASQLAQESRLLRQSQMTEQNARRIDRKKAPVSGSTSSTVPGAGDTGQPTTEKPISKVISSGPGQLVVETADGDRQKRIGNANWRMNNPGNLRASPLTQQQPGFVGVANAGDSGDFAVFATKQDGSRAKENLLFSGKTVYANKTLREAMYKYAPEEDKNKTEAYIRAIVDAVGVPDSTFLADFTPSQRQTMMSTIERVEGFQVGKVVAAADGGMFRGPKSGYPAVLHGHEAVIPLKNGSVPVSLPALDDLVFSNRSMDAQVQVLRNEMGSIMRELTAALTSMKEGGSQERMIQLLESISRSQQTTAAASTKMAQLAAN